MRVSQLLGLDHSSAAGGEGTAERQDSSPPDSPAREDDGYGDATNRRNGYATAPDGDVNVDGSTVRNMNATAAAPSGPPVDLLGGDFEDVGGADGDGRGGGGGENADAMIDMLGVGDAGGTGGAAGSSTSVNLLGGVEESSPPTSQVLDFSGVDAGGRGGAMGTDGGSGRGVGGLNDFLGLGSDGGGGGGGGGGGSVAGTVTGKGMGKGMSISSAPNPSGVAESSIFDAPRDGHGGRHDGSGGRAAVAAATAVSSSASLFEDLSVKDAVGSGGDGVSSSEIDDSGNDDGRDQVDAGRGSGAVAKGEKKRGSSGFSFMAEGDSEVTATTIDGGGVGRDDAAGSSSGRPGQSVAQTGLFWTHSITRS